MTWFELLPGILIFSVLHHRRRHHLGVKHGDRRVTVEHAAGYTASGWRVRAKFLRAVLCCGSCPQDGEVSGSARLSACPKLPHFFI
jgi:hypothetical protein